MKKILYIHHAIGWGGPTNSLIKLINSLDHSKYEAEVLLLKNSMVADKLIENGINYKVADSVFYKRYYQFFPHSEAGYIKWYQIYSFLRLSLLWILSRYYFAGKELANYDVDIVHLNSSVLTDWLAPAKEKGMVIIHIREPFRSGKLDVLHYYFKREIRKYADRIIAISEDNALRINIPDKTEIIYNYSEIPTSSPPESSYATKKVLYLGGSSSSKGFYTLVEALDYLDKDVKIYFGGKYIISKKSGNIIHLLKFYLSKAKIRNAAIQKINKHPNAIVIGLIQNVQDYLEEVCCLVSPYMVPHFSRPNIEAHLHKKPAIGSDVEGMDEIITHEKNGLIVPKNNPKALAAAINTLTADSEKAKRLGEEGYKIAIQKYTPQNIRQFECLYVQL
jgi:glycosyltransferase involved in cell wall biosynthesis